MLPSTEPHYDTKDGWFQFDLSTASSIEFMFNDGVGVNWDNNSNTNYIATSAGSYTVASEVTGFKTGDLVRPNDDTGYHILFQAPSWSQPYFQYNAGSGWLEVPGYAMSPSSYLGKFSAANGWFQYDILSASLVQIAFNNGDGLWDSTVGSSHIWTSPGTEMGGILTINLAVNSALLATPYGDDLSTLVVTVSKTENDRVRVKIADKTSKRYTQNPFTFKVTRTSDGFTLFDSSGVPLVVKDQYLQVSTSLNDDLSVYGIGESTRDNFRMTSGEKYTLWARDQISSTPNVNTYGSHPFFLGLNSAGEAHGVLLLNSNGMDVTMKRGHLVYQTIGGVLDFNILMGPSPAEALSQYTKLIGRPKLMPYWSYGFHQCRWGYGSVDALRTVVNKYASNNLPLDVVWSDIDYMDRSHGFTLDPTNFKQREMAAFIKEIHAHGQKFIPIIDPGIPDDANDYAYTKGLEMDIFIKDTNGSPYLGQVWPGPTFFPDFFHPDAKAFWGEQLQHLYNKIEFDGLWIDMNEIANFCPGAMCGATSITGYFPSGAWYDIFNYSQIKSSGEAVTFPTTLEATERLIFSVLDQITKSST
ncbi:hypothetical protein BBO99_00005491 [Phytophthora kernoviae]|uniref:Maltase n=2 Tax=Phytophthora kernoviae TaxID=325452 RepID=A0A3R7NFF1_9STRA|nr:hypothetical protein G195_007469 [Phytophthora kernoviae 00238/432]KAG2520464.1 hypothetical protein JM16_006690 [Phytophthora kernoviae]KAG2521533.1 hypothetical protein JM18_006531 [Phytophthora kernoviae]RLN46043.1 hypothetical protein BBI17_005588 [Phytophthora kernoviae]RLN79121.1 hypothetical protein BBO99_00005491 [Phytophthora kernoviae]